MDILTLTILVASIALQLVTAALALRLTRLSLGSGIAWVLLASAMVLMAGRRIVTMVGLQYPDVEASVRGPLAETVALVISILMLVGVRNIPPIFRQRDQLIERSRQQAAQLQSILDNVVDAVIVCDARGKLTLVNPATRRLYDLAEDQSPPRSIADFIGPFRLCQPDGRALSVEELPLSRALAGEIVIDSDMIQYRPSDGKNLYRRSTAAPIRDDAGAIVGAVVVSRDITEQVEFERLKDQFVGVAAHELKTPVTIMKGYAQALVRAGSSLSPDVQRGLGAIDRGADRIGRIVDDLITISDFAVHPLALRAESVDLTALAGDVVGAVTSNVPAPSVKLVTAMPARVMGDREHLRQVMRRLVDNAVKFSPAGREVEVAVTVASGEAIVSVKDYGVGIDPDKQARIFEQFYRAHTDTPHDHGGMGVGLYLAKKIMTELGGKIGFQSEPVSGSRFWFSLPVEGENDDGANATGHR